MEAISVNIESPALGITFAIISHPNSIKATNSAISKMGSVCHSKAVLFIVSLVLIILATTRMSCTTAPSLDQQFLSS